MYFHRCRVTAVVIDHAIYALAESLQRLICADVMAGDAVGCRMVTVHG
jgi:hypothetical protein